VSAEENKAIMRRYFSVLSKATSTFSMSCWHPTMSTTPPPLLTCQRALRESKEW
jgi:hypothetical protein